MKVVILGSKGALGSSLSKLYRKHEPKTWDRKEVDITHPESAEKKLVEFKPDVVFNCAAYNAVDKAEEEPEKADEVNGYAVGSLAKICNKIDAILVHYSTEQVFDGQNPAGYNETDIPNPVNRYGQSKLLGEVELQKYHDRYYLIRTEWLYAPHNNATGKKSFNDIMLELHTNGHNLTGVVDEIGKPTYVKDLALASKELIDSSSPFGIYHLVNEGVASRLDWAKEIFKIKNIDVEIESVTGDTFPRKARRPHYGLLNNTKCSPLRPWQEALTEYLSTNKS